MQEENSVRNDSKAEAALHTGQMVGAVPGSHEGRGSLVGTKRRGMRRFDHIVLKTIDALASVWL